MHGRIKIPPTVQRSLLDLPNGWHFFREASHPYWLPASQKSRIWLTGNVARRMTRATRKDVLLSYAYESSIRWRKARSLTNGGKHLRPGFSDDLRWLQTKAIGNEFGIFHAHVSLMLFLVHMTLRARRRVSFVLADWKFCEKWELCVGRDGSSDSGSSSKRGSESSSSWDLHNIHEDIVLESSARRLSRLVCACPILSPSCRRAFWTGSSFPIFGSFFVPSFVW